MHRRQEVLLHSAMLGHVLPIIRRQEAFLHSAMLDMLLYSRQYPPVGSATWEDLDVHQSANGALHCPKTCF